MVMKRIIAYVVCFSFLISAPVVFAEIMSLVKEYTYQASELDSKTTCRAIALEQVKRELLEELGTYVESTTVVQNNQIDQDEIRTISAGVVQTKVLDETWDGRNYWLKAQVSADPDEVAASIDKVRNDQKLAEELAESEAEKEKALQDVERLQAELAQSNADKEKLAQYNDAVTQLQASDYYQQGTAMTVAGDYDGATRAYDQAIYLRPEDPKIYFGRSIVFIYIGNYQLAAQDIDRAMVIRPAYTNVYFQRASAYKEIRETRLVNDPRWVRQHPRLPLRPMTTAYDPLKRFLDQKQAQYKFVKVNPFHPPPVVKRDPRQIQPRPYQVKREQHFVKQTANPDIRKQGNLPQRDFDRRQDKPAYGQPVKPDIYKKGDVPPPANLERKPTVVTPQVGDPRGIQRRDLNQEQQKTLQLQRQKEMDQQRALQMQKQRALQMQQRRQVNVPPPQQPRVVEKKPPVVQRQVQRVPKKEEKKTPQQLKEEEEKNRHR
jgi:tetratricopeptide (TPR) repeat protein